MVLAVPLPSSLAAFAAALDNLNGISFRGHKFCSLSVMACNGAGSETHSFYFQLDVADLPIIQ